MIQTHALDRVIRTAAPDEIPRTRAEKIVLVDLKDKVVVPKKKFFHEVQAYLVSNSSDVSNAVQVDVPAFRLHDLDHNVEISISTDVRCRPGNEARAALELFDPAEGPGKMLERALTRWTIELSDGGVAAFVRGYCADRAALERRIVERALAETGLDLHVKLQLDESSLNKIYISRDLTSPRERLRVALSDYTDAEQLLGVKATLEFD